MLHHYWAYMQIELLWCWRNEILNTISTTQALLHGVLALFPPPITAIASHKYYQKGLLIGCVIFSGSCGMRARNKANDGVLDHPHLVWWGTCWGWGQERDPAPPVHSEATLDYQTVQHSQVCAESQAAVSQWSSVSERVSRRDNNNT